MQLLRRIESFDVGAFSRFTASTHISHLLKHDDHHDCLPLSSSLSALISSLMGLYSVELSGHLSA